MKNKTTLYFGLILSSLLIFSCAEEESDISALNSRISELTTIVEQHDNKVSDYLAEDFVTAKKLNRAQFLLFLNYHGKRNKNISIITLDKNIIKNKADFDVTFRVLLLGSNNLLPERGQMYQVASRWKKESGTWVISKLRWEKTSASE